MRVIQWIVHTLQNSASCKLNRRISWLICNFLHQTRLKNENPCRMNSVYNMHERLHNNCVSSRHWAVYFMAPAMALWNVCQKPTANSHRLPVQLVYRHCVGSVFRSYKFISAYGNVCVSSTDTIKLWQSRTFIFSANGTCKEGIAIVYSETTNRKQILAVGCVHTHSCGGFVQSPIVFQRWSNLNIPGLEGFDDSKPWRR